jgi:EAL domain-containing protein (putative c-di-GMP-specific phosphodiesterase class I)
MGGSHNAGPHLFYVAIVLAAVRFSWPVTAAVAVAAGLLAGPLLPADVALNIGQEPGAWMLRLSIFVLIGSFIALLVEDPEAALRNRRLEAIGAAGLLRALDTGEIEVFYQPICRVQDGRLAGVEALVRWRQPEGGYADPSTFIPIAERTGAISRLDEYVLRRAIATARDWASRAHPLYVSVNLSVTTLAGSWLVATIDRVLDETGLPPHLLQIEITESAVIDDLAGTIRQVAALRARGVKVAIDDFGSGHASLGYLQNLPVDVVKLDRSMVTAAAFDDRSHRMLEGVTRMCDLLGLQVIAEGVELPQQLACLSEMGVSMAQGYLLGPPAPPAEIRALIDGSVSP